jgi:cephalosporin-C deacetylase
MFVDLPLDELRRYRPDVAEPSDFDAFWAAQLAAADAVPPATYRPVDTPLRHADVFDVSFPGHQADPVAGWLLVPHRLRPDAALIVEYIGYGGGRGHPADWLRWSSAGFPHFVMDTRGQGGGWRASDTRDPSDAGAPSTPGFVTRGVGDPATYYYTRLFVDAVRAVTAARRHPVAHDRPIVAAGTSQGGGLALAAGHLAPGVAAVLPDVPFLAHPRRAVEVTDAAPYRELIDYCAVHTESVDEVFHTLSYVDVVNHARRATVPALFSVGLRDEITPASTVFAAFNHYAGRKDIRVYPFGDHECAGTPQFLAQLDFLAGLHRS